MSGHRHSMVHETGGLTAEVDREMGMWFSLVGAGSIRCYLKPGTRFTFSVPVGLCPGSYSLGCNIDVDMKGTLVVGE